MNYKKISTKRENEIAKDISGRRHTGSGNKWHSKGDASNQFLLIEDKFVISDKYSIQLNILNKLTKQAQKQSKIPILRFGFINKEFLNNFACIEKCYCNELLINKCYSTSKKSSIFTYSELYASIISAFGQPVVLQLTFEKEDKTFFIIEWEEFLKFQQKIIVSI